MASEDQPHLVQALYSFKGRNNDELCFKKGDIITVTQTEEGGWWEGTFGETTAWFPSNYVKEYKPNSDSLSLSKSHSTDWAAKQKAYRSFVLKDLIESERAHVSELQGLYHNFLLPIEKAEIMKKSEYDQLVGNLSEVLEVHTSLLDSLREAATQASSEQRVGRVFLTAAPHLKHILMAYCAAHPRAVLVLERYKQELSALMEANGAVSPGLLVLTAGLSKPFRRLDKYAGMLQEMERHVEESHPDRGDTQRSVAVYKDIASSCSMMRRQKEMEVEVVSGGVRGWEGSEELSALGDIVHMGSVAVGPEHRDRYLVLFPTTLLVLSVSHRMSAFIYEGKLPLTGINVNKLEETENCKNSFEIVGPMIERIVAVCQTKEDQQTWIDLLRQQIRAVRGGGGGGVPTSPKPLLATSPTTATTNLVSCKQKIRQSDTKRATSQGSVKYENRLAGTKNLGNCGAGLNNQLSKCESGLVAENNLPKCESGFHPDMRLAATSSSTRLLSPYARLAAYFARLVRRGVLTRKIVRRLLYRQFAVEGLVDTSMVRRRRSHRTECVIYPQKAVRTWVQESDDEEDEEAEEEGEEEEEEGSVESSGFQYLKGGVYRSTLTVMKVGVPDLSRMDSRTAISNHLTVDDHTLSSSAAYQQRQSMPSPTLRRPLPPVHSASLDLPPPPVREIVTPTSVSTCSCPPSHRSSDSGLADVTTHHVETPCRCGRNHNNSGDDLIILEKTTCVCQSGNLVKYDGCSCRNVNESEIRLKCNYDGGIDQVTTSVDRPYGDLNKNHEFEEDMRLKCSFEDSDCPYSDLNKNHECEEDIRLKYGYEDEATNVECTYSDVNRNQFTCYMSKRYSRDDVLNEVVSNFDSNCSDLNEKCRCPHNDTECSQEDDLDSRHLVENCYQDGVTSKESTREKVQIIGNKLAGKMKCTTQGHVSDENVVYDDVATRKWSLQDDVTASERRDNDVINNDFKESDNFYDVIKTQLPQDDVITIGNNVMNLDSGGINTFDDVRTAVRSCSDEDEQELPLTYRSGMYAHWWLKTHLPSADAASDDFAAASHDSVAASDDCERRRQRSHTDCGEQ